MVVGSTPTIGQHTQEILKEIAKYSDDEIVDLATEKVVRLS